MMQTNGQANAFRWGHEGAQEHEEVLDFKEMGLTSLNSLFDASSNTGCQSRVFIAPPVIR